MRAIRMLLVSALALGTLSAHAGENDVKRLTDLLEKSQTIEANFSQLTLDAGGTSLQETTGKMTVKRPGLFYWHTDAPQEQVVVSDGQKVTLWDPDLEQATVKKLDVRLNQTPALLLSASVALFSPDLAHAMAKTARMTTNEKNVTRSRGMFWRMTSLLAA